MDYLDINKATQPYDYYIKFIKQNCRPDNRKLSDVRPCNIKVDCINTIINGGSSIVRLGLTNVVCGITARVCRPKEDRPDKGFIIFISNKKGNVELPALSSSKNFKNMSNYQSTSLSTATVEQSQAMLSQLMQDILQESKCINENDLCIKEGKLVWVLYIDLICLNNDGNVQDACCLAMITALKSVCLYEMDYDLDENKIIVKKPLNKIKLKLYNEPVCTTLFALEDNILLSDPNKQEEDFMRAYMIICTIDKTKMCLIRKYGSLALTSEQLNLCIERALINGNFFRENFYKALFLKKE